MIRQLEKLTRRGLRRIEVVFDAVFEVRWNPWYQLGALSFHFFWILVATGVYLFVFFDTSITGAYQSVEQLSNAQWYFGGVLRSLHRYATDAMAITVTLHLLREFSLGRFRGPRSFSWSSGVPLLWLLFAAAIGGYLLVWDRLAQYIAVATSEWIDALPLLGSTLARNFLSNATLTDRLFSLLVFMHIAIPLFLLAGMFIHVKRLKLARTDPPRGLVIGSCAALLLLAIVKPARSQGPADLATTVASVKLDWFYLNLYPLLDSWGPAAVWLLLFGLTCLLMLLPWLSPEAKGLRQAAVVNPQNCNGCGWCFKDCPYDAVTMVVHEFKPGHRQAVVDADICTACGICAGACPSATPFRHVEDLVSGIEMPAFSIAHLHSETLRKIATLQGESRILLFGCDHALDVQQLQQDDVAALSLPCAGLLPPSFVDFAARLEGVDGVMVSGCNTEDCFHRRGSEWIEQRLDGRRMPHLRTSAGRHKVRVCWAGLLQQRKLGDALDRLRTELRDTSMPDIPAKQQEPAVAKELKVAIHE